MSHDEFEKLAADRKKLIVESSLSDTVAPNTVSLLNVNLANNTIADTPDNEGQFMGGGGDLVVI